MSPLRRCDCTVFLTFLVLSHVSPTSSALLDYAPTTEPETTLTPFVPPELTPAHGHVALISDIYVAGYERSHPELCPALGEHLSLLIFVISAPENKTAREAVRLTWGHYVARSDVAMGFILGQPTAKLRPVIEAEDALYADIIIGNSVDSYFNQTLRTLSMLQWIDTYCPSVPRILKTNDDVFINVPQLLNWIAKPERANATRTIWGHLKSNVTPERDTDSKYYISKVQYVEDIYPDYVSGAAYLLTADVVRPLLREALVHPYMYLEDVMVTGVLGKQLGLKLVNETTFYDVKMQPDSCTVQKGISFHDLSYREQFDLWRKLIDTQTECKQAKLK